MPVMLGEVPKSVASASPGVLLTEYTIQRVPSPTLGCAGKTPHEGHLGPLPWTPVAGDNASAKGEGDEALGGCRCGVRCAGVGECLRSGEPGRPIGGPATAAAGPGRGPGGARMGLL